MSDLFDKPIPAWPIPSRLVPVCLILGCLIQTGLIPAVFSTRARAEIIIDDHFPGYAENPDWLYDWITGVGSVSFNAASPGYARFLMDGPAADTAYHNAELYQQINETPPYCDFVIRLRNSNNCGYDAPGWPPDPDPLYGMGSRGWGLWNRSTDPLTTPLNIIWFSCNSPESDEAFRGRSIRIIRNNIPVVMQEMNIDLTEWHTYRIKWRPDYIGVYIDDQTTPVAEVTSPGGIPSVPLTFTTWIDNYIITGSTIFDLAYGWLPVPDFEQYIDVDYVRVFTVNDPGDFDGDGDVDPADFDAFSSCFTGTGGGPVEPECEPGDFDYDGDIDCDDWDQFVLVWTEPSEPPVFPQCTEPAIGFQPVSFAFNAISGGPQPPDQTLEIWNAGGLTLEWLVDADMPWLALSPTAGSSTGEIDEVTVGVEMIHLPPAGVHGGTITITDPDATNSPQTVPVTLIVDQIIIGSEPDHLAFLADYGGVPPNDQILEIWNAGSGTLVWSVSDDAPWLTLDPLSGSSTGEHDTVMVNVDQGTLDPGSYQAEITITAPNAVNSPRHVPVDLFVDALAGDSLLVVGPGPGYQNPALVRVFPPLQDAAHAFEFSAYGSPHHGVRVSCGDVNGDELDEILTGAGPGAMFGPHVRGFRGDGTPLEQLSFLAYGTNRYGVNVAAGDLDGDGYDEIVTGAGPGAVFGPHVRAFDYDGSPGVVPVPGVSYFAYGTPKWGVNVTAGDIDGDGYDEIVTGAGPGSVYGPHVRGWDVDGSAAAAIARVSFLAYGTNKNGVTASCGDVDGDGIEEIITAPGPGGSFGSHIRGWNFDGVSITGLPGIDFFAWPPYVARYGARIFAGADLNGDGSDEIVTGPGPDPAFGCPVRVYRYDGSQIVEWFSLQAFPAEYTHGADAAGGRFDTAVHSLPVPKISIPLSRRALD